MKANLVHFLPFANPVGEAMIDETNHIVRRRLDFAAPREELDAAMAAAHGYHVLPRVELREPWFFDADLLRRAPNLLAASSTGAGYDVIDVEACTQAGVIVCHQSGTNKEAVAEHALGLMLVLSKRIPQADKALRRGAAPDRFALTGSDIIGKTVGIIGIGQIGTRVAELCRGLFRMTVLACDPFLTAAEVAARGAVKVTMEELLERSDFVTVHTPRDATTLGMMGAAQFARMKPTAYFIQTARGGIHDEAALAEALEHGRIAGAGLDVWVTEPPPADHPLLRFENVIASPHNAGITHEALHEMARAAAEQWIGIFRGEVPPRLVNPEAWPRYAARFREAFGFAPADLPR
ncbi:NAD(P)-dependent oxidoreductase [Falsiroseomonas oryzae]|uniref:NAD(P)-dependent oxidoreductase n=1 Tax=Falsiroseomonas oryzae TaxID=2766473 RepID=UPI0022EAA628|nr:NAD(P)-dependent oxidoreductase [Roseomonas sp. MO-31]